MPAARSESASSSPAISSSLYYGITRFILQAGPNKDRQQQRKIRFSAHVWPCSLVSLSIYLLKSKLSAGPLEAPDGLRRATPNGLQRRCQPEIVYNCLGTVRFNSMSNQCERAK